MKPIEYLLLGLVFVILIGCSSKQKEDSEKTITIFFQGLRDSNVDVMSAKYKNIYLFDSYYKSDSIQILESKKINDTIINVKVKNFFTNGFGKKNVKEIIFYISMDSIKSFTKIIDSKGLTDHTSNKLFDFAKKIGCLKKNDSTDVQKKLKLKEAKNILYDLQIETLANFMTNVIVVDWSWDSGYSGSASGKGIVKNNTVFSIPDVRYQIKYKDKNGNVLTTDDGYVTYDKINSGESKSFTFYTSYVGNASRASIILEFDDKMIEDYLLNSKEYNGNEYEKYLNERTY